MRALSDQGSQHPLALPYRKGAVIGALMPKKREQLQLTGRTHALGTCGTQKFLSEILVVILNYMNQWANSVQLYYHHYHLNYYYYFRTSFHKDDS